jgi:hypothetical protein
MKTVTTSTYGNDKIATEGLIRSIEKVKGPIIVHAVKKRITHEIDLTGILKE